MIHLKRGERLTTLAAKVPDKYGDKFIDELLDKMSSSENINVNTDIILSDLQIKCIYQILEKRIINIKLKAMIDKGKEDAKLRLSLCQEKY